MKSRNISLTTAIFLLIFFFFTANLSAQQVSGSEQTPDYETALKTLLALEQKGIVNADLYNQIGLSYYHQGLTGKAVLYFLRSLRLESNHKEARNNLEYAFSQSLDAELYPQPTFLADLFRKGIDFFSLNTLAIITLIILVLTILCLHWLLQSPHGEEKTVQVMWLLIIGFILVLCSVLLAFKYKDYNNINKAVIIGQMADGCSGPGEEYGNLFTVHAGLIVHISRMDKDWALVTLPNGGAGWVHASVLERVKP